MTIQIDLDDFARQIYQEAEQQEDTYAETHFTKFALEILADADQIDSYIPCYYSKRGMKTNGYFFNVDEGTLDLYVCKYFGVLQNDDSVYTLAKSEINTLYLKARKFFEQGLVDLAETIDETTEEFNLAYQIRKEFRKFDAVRIFILTDGTARTKLIETDDLKHGKTIFKFSCRVFDLEEIANCQTSGTELGPLEIDLSEHGGSIPCLPAIDCEADFQVCVAMMPGTMLFSLYEEYGSRLLERNVRSFLQAKGKTNKGIKDTIFHTPGRFLAYNNGISCTAEEIRYDQTTAEWKIKWLKNLQIVNGGQTTASIHNAAKRYGADLSRVMVPAKISVVKSTLVDDAVTKISLYANSQNKITDSDFYALDSFHTKLEQFSRRIFAPATLANNRLTHWYYERARGAYLHERSRSDKPATFDELYPVSQKMTKVELAKFANVWDEKPDSASQGDQKNFRLFTLRAGEEEIKVTEQYFKDIIAKAILYRFTESAAKRAKIPAYKSQTVNYSLSYVVHSIKEKIDLGEIWKKQSVPEFIQRSIEKVIPIMHEQIKLTAGTANPSEWTKKAACWKVLSEISLKL